MSNLDLIIVLLYLLLLLGVGIFVGLKETAEDFLILSRRAKLPLVLFSLVSSWVGVGAFVGTAAGGYDTGISVGFTSISAAFFGVFAVAIFAPIIKNFGDKFSAHTIGDFFRIRYSKGSQFLVAIIVILSYLLFTGVQFTGLALLLKIWTNLSFETAMIIAAISTIIYTAFAGIKSDFYTDVIHFWVMVIVLFGVLLPITWSSVNGFSNFNSLPTSYFYPFAFGGVPFFIGGLIFGIGVALVSMEFWQKIYASIDKKTAKKALMGSVIFIVAFYLLAMFLGMTAKILFPSIINRDLALFTLMKNLLPTGALGLGVAAFLAVFISSVNTMIMVASVSFTKDFYKGLIRPSASDSQILKIGRISTIIIGLLGLLLAFYIRDILTLSSTALFMLLIFLPSILGGFFWKRATAKAAFLSVFLGFVTGVVLIPQMPTTAFVPGFGVSLIVFIITSFLTQHSQEEDLLVVRDWRN